MFNNPLVHFSRHCDLAYWNSKTAGESKNTRVNITVKIELVQGACFHWMMDTV